jgi:protein associated with RNAse G/E
MNYPDEINYIIKEELSALIEMKKAGVFPFDKKIIEHYYDIFKEIKKK